MKTTKLLSLKVTRETRFFFSLNFHFINWYLSLQIESNISTIVKTNKNLHQQNCTTKKICWFRSKNTYIMEYPFTTALSDKVMVNKQLLFDVLWRHKVMTSAQTLTYFLHFVSKHFILIILSLIFNNLIKINFYFKLQTIIIRADN